MMRENSLLLIALRARALSFRMDGISDTFIDASVLVDAIRYFLFRAINLGVDWYTKSKELTSMCVCGKEEWVEQKD